MVDVRASRVSIVKGYSFKFGCLSASLILPCALQEVSGADTEQGEESARLKGYYYPWDHLILQTCLLQPATHMCVFLSRLISEDTVL